MAHNLREIAAMSAQLQALLEDPNLDLEPTLRRDMQALLQEMQAFRAQATTRGLELAGTCDDLVAWIEEDIQAGRVSAGNIEVQLLLAQTRDAGTHLRGIAMGTDDIGT
jgi:hypothetical protein